MGQYTSYWLYQKYETRGSQEPIPCYPNVYSVDGDGTMPLVVRKEDDTQCGYVPPIVVKYRWVNIPITQDFICDECSSLQFRWVRSDDTICIEEEPQTIYRWVNMDTSVDYYCEGTTKYYKQKKQVSYDSGLDWEDVTPPEYQKGGVAEEQSTDCGYVPPTPKKLVVKYSGNITREVECNDNSTLTNGETKPSGYQYTAMTSAFIGDCVGTVGDYTFRDCTSLTSVTISNGVGELGSTVFGNCTSLTSITIPDSCYRIGYGVFSGCISLTSVTIPNSVTRIGELAFVRCSGLTSINIPSGLTRVETETFERCRSLTSVTIPSGVTFIGRYAFSECSGLTSVTVLATTPPTLGNYAFDDTNNCPIYVPCESVETYKNTEGWSTYASRINGIPPCAPPPTPTFDGKFKLTYSGGSVVSGECSSNTTLTNGDTNPSGYQSSAMTSAEIGDCVTAIGTIAFRYCSGLTSVVIGSGVTTIGEAAFGYCYALADITIPDSVTSINYGGFYYCSGLTSVSIGSGITSIGNMAFQYCKGLSSVTCLATTPPTLGSYAFDDTKNCPIYVPASSVNAYKTATNWSRYKSRIQAIS